MGSSRIRDWGTKCPVTKDFMPGKGVQPGNICNLSVCDIQLWLEGSEGRRESWRPYRWLLSNSKGDSDPGSGRGPEKGKME